MSEMREQDFYCNLETMYECELESMVDCLVSIFEQRSNLINSNTLEPRKYNMMMGLCSQDVPDFGMIAMQAGLCRWVWERDRIRELIDVLDKVWDRVVDATDTQDLRLIRDIQKVNDKLDVARLVSRKWEHPRDETKEGADA